MNTVLNAAVVLPEIPFHHSHNQHMSNLFEHEDIVFHGPKMEKCYDNKITKFLLSIIPKPNRKKDLCENDGVSGTNYQNMHQV